MHFLVFLWIPTYYNQNYGVDLKESALLSVFPWCCAIVATMTAGAVADALNSREVLPLTQVRKLMQGIGSFGPAGCLFYLAWLDKVSRAYCGNEVPTLHANLPSWSASNSLMSELYSSASHDLKLMCKVQATVPNGSVQSSASLAQQLTYCHGL